MVSREQMKFLQDHRNKKIKIRIFKILILILFLSLWQIGVIFNVLDDFFYSSPFAIVKTFSTMLVSGKLLLHIFTTLIETLLSFSISIGLGIIIAVFLWTNDFMKKVLEPYLVLLNSMPKTALAPLIIVWFGNNYKAIIITAVSIGIFTTIITLLSAIDNSYKNEIKLIKIFGGNKKDELLEVLLPGNISTIISICKTNIGLSLIGVIIGEFLVGGQGLGYLIMYGSQTFKMDWVIMSIVLLGIIAFSLYWSISILEKRYSAYIY